MKRGTHPRTDEYKKYMSNKMKEYIAKKREEEPDYRCGKKHPGYGIKLSKETKEKISKAHMGITPWNKGKKYTITYKPTQETRQKMGDWQVKSDNPNWRGGRYVNPSGYVIIWISRNKYVTEHKVVAEKYLGRKLNSGEVIHHIDGNKQNNKPSNLMVCGRGEHKHLHHKLADLCQTILFASYCYDDINKQTNEILDYINKRRVNGKITGAKI